MQKELTKLTCTRVSNQVFLLLIMSPLSLLLVCCIILFSVSALSALSTIKPPIRERVTANKLNAVPPIRRGKTGKSTKDIVISDHSSSFWKTFAAYNKVCVGATNNIRTRPGAAALRKDWTLTPLKNWTMSSTLMQAMMGVPLEQWDEHTSGTRSSSIPPCDTVEDIAQFFASAPARGGQQHCRLLWFDRPSYCALFNKFAGVMFSGDSLTRHMMQALHMIGSQNWDMGSYPCAGEAIVLGCRCDGQVRPYNPSLHTNECNFLPLYLGYTKRFTLI